MGSNDSRNDVDALLTLIEHDRANEVSNFLGKRPDLARQADRHGDLPLHHAAALGRGRIVRILLSYGAPLDEVDGRGFTALQSAVRYEHTEIVRALLDAGADPSVPSPDGITILSVPSQTSDAGRAMFVDLLEAGADIDLYLAVALGQPMLVAALLRHQQETVRHLPYADELLEIACRLYPGSQTKRFQRRRQLIVSALLDYGFDPNRYRGWPPLHCAVLANDADCVEKLIAHGADPHVIVGGRLLAEYAQAHSARDALAVLREHGADFG